MVIFSLFLIQEYLSPDSPIAIAAMVVASIGIIVTSYIIYVFIKFRDTAVVRASGKEIFSKIFYAKNLALS